MGLSGTMPCVNCNRLGWYSLLGNFGPAFFEQVSDGWMHRTVVGTDGHEHVQMICSLDCLKSYEEKLRTSMSPGNTGVQG